MNYARTAVLLAALTGLFLAIGYLIAGTGGMIVAFLLALASNAFAYWNADKISTHPSTQERIARLKAMAQA